MRAIRRYTIVPTLPTALVNLQTIAENLRWSWDETSVELFRTLDAELWDNCNHNPVLFLQRIDQDKLDAAAEDSDYLTQLEQARQSLSSYVTSSETWYRRLAGEQGLPAEQPLIAYFSAEFGLTESIPIFAGGLGILAGDHIKSSSDLDLPLVGVGLLYQMGYFQQRIDAQGWQQAIPRENDFETLPIHLERQDDGAPRQVSVEIAGRTVYAQIWRAQVGRTAVYLLDTNVESNDEDDRRITERLYDSDPSVRLQQEILLGIGGLRALHVLGLAPQVIHLNEGHAAFAILERIRQLVEAHGLSFAEARLAAAPGIVFTTHTPVAAGHDRFAPALIDEYFSDLWPQIGLSRDEFLALGREDPSDDFESFTMTILALKLAQHRGGVSKLHGETTRVMWQQLWPDLPVNEIPIGHITNGVHLPTWLAPEIAELYQRHLGDDWQDAPSVDGAWEELSQITDEELWSTHNQQRAQLIEFAQRRLRTQLQRQGAHPADIEATLSVLDPAVLTIGFARRFATYKRGALLLTDIERLTRIVTDAERPVQFIFAGKAHPDDIPGQEVIHEILTAISDGPLRGRIVFLEDYDITIARHLVHGVDVWLNNPRRPLEASGTSGMKAAANGGLNLSILDGWWDEAWQLAEEKGLHFGWPIGEGKVYLDEGYADRGDAQAIYQTLERDIVPLFYDRDEAGIPRRWVSGMRQAIRWLSPFFNTNRMVADYWAKYYLPALQGIESVRADGYRSARELAAREACLREAWPAVEIVDVMSPEGAELRAGSKICISASIQMDGINPDDILVELYAGEVTPDDKLVRTFTQEMRAEGTGKPLLYRTELEAPEGGSFGWTVRVVPRDTRTGKATINSGLIRWAQSSVKR